MPQGIAAPVADWRHVRRTRKPLQILAERSIILEACRKVRILRWSEVHPCRVFSETLQGLSCHHACRDYRNVVDYLHLQLHRASPDPA